MKTIQKHLRFNSLITYPGLISCLVWAGFGQTKTEWKSENYTILRNNKPIGKVYTKCYKKGDHYYSLSTRVEVRILVIITYTVDYKSKFKSDHIHVSSTYKQSLSGFSQKYVRLKKPSMYYQVWSDNELSGLEKDHIVFNAFLLYFDESVDISTIYSKNQEKFVSIRQLTDHKYVLILENGKESYYQYSKNELVRLDSSCICGTLSIVRNKPDSYAKN